MNRNEQKNESMKEGPGFEELREIVSQADTPDKPAIPKRKRISRGGGRVRRVFVRVFYVIYLIGVLAFGYWYWTRPVRADQFRSAHRMWYGIAESVGIPVPEDERWGG